ncbi:MULTISPECIES: ROK family protein [unclassified Duganella]|uniref:ROK family protein n=1 Tax=unclassified Duganella TaxID=2636909 RepID=UPI000E348183|nr:MULTISPECIES: ROK family protein [unclassified Duganella]RFP18719.1 ROK family protein [Duganella sp. BJB475]RFP35384.1 ROK family protein [Duganella sp. BJB476]
MRPPELFYGIDLGGTKIELVACDAALQVVYRRRIATPHQDFDTLLAALAGLVLAADAELGTCAPLGLGIPGIIDAASGAHLSTNVPALCGRQLLPALRAQLRRGVVMGNDCQCFALSEAHGGAAAGQPSMLGLILGTGAGAGYCADGLLLAGRQGVLGEWGHWPLAPALLARHGLPPWPCGCGASACLERYLSGRGVSALHQHLSGQAGASAAQLAERRAAGDAAAQAVYALHLELLGAAIATLVLAYDPHVIVLGGGLSRLPHLYRELPAAIAPHLLSGLRPPPILPPMFGDAGGARGAALLARQAGTHLVTEHA